MSIVDYKLSSIISGKYDKMSIIVDKTFADWLNEALKKQGMTQAELARRSGLTRQAISSYLSGKRETPEPEALISLARALKVAPDTLYRAAGLLPPIDPSEADLEDFREILKNLSPEEREELKAIGWLKIDRKKKKK